jgi:hypothetical protein
MKKNSSAALQAWRKWHHDIPAEDIPAVSLAFEKGFDAGMQYRKSRDNEKMKDALIKLRDCDWVISLPDRMTEVRNIARAALEA